MASSVERIDHRIIKCLGLLNDNEKKEILLFVEAIKNRHEKSSPSHLTAEQIKELNATLMDHKAGKLKYYSL